MLTIALMLAAALFAPPQGQDASISGVVRDSVTGKPVTGIAVKLISMGEVPSGAVAYTTETGQFSFVKVPPGSYSLLVSHNSIMVQEHVLGLRAGEVRSGLELRLVPGAEISGTVLDEAGVPLTNARVEVVERRIENGKVVYPYEHPANVDPSGRFRVPGLPAGEYIVRAGPGVLGGFPASSEVWADRPAARADLVEVYHPGTERPSKAAVIRISPGQKVEDIALRVPARPLVRLEVNLDVPPEAKGGGLSLMIAAIGSEEEPERPGIAPPIPVSKGHSLARELPTGWYLLTAMCGSQAGEWRGEKKVNLQPGISPVSIRLTKVAQ